MFYMQRKAVYYIINIAQDENLGDGCHPLQFLRAIAYKMPEPYEL